MDIPLRILVAEDDAGDALLLCRALARAGLAAPVIVLRDGQEVIDYLQGHPPFDHPGPRSLPNLLLLDLKMPRVDGFGVIQWLRDRGLLKHILVVVLSSSADSEDLRRACALGAVFYVVKPSAPGELFRIVERVHDYWREAVSSQTIAAVPVR